MATEKYNRRFRLACPTCGGERFGPEPGAEKMLQVLKCASCGRTLTQDELVQANSDNIAEQIKQVSQQAAGGIGAKLKESLKNVFKRNKDTRTQ